MLLFAAALIFITSACGIIDRLARDEADVKPAGFSFSAEDLYGNTVTEETLGEKEFFFLYAWQTT
jgi:hypothetical protein